MKKGKPAATAGVQVGEYIHSIDGQFIANKAAFENAFLSCLAGDSIEVKLLGQGSSHHSWI